jgi:hypothetical protein
MTTCRDVITYALRQARVISAGEEPEASEAADGLTALQAMYDGWVSGGMFGRLEDVYLTSNDTAEEGKRYLLASGVTLTTPTTISAEDSEDGEIRQPRDLSLFESVTSAGVRSVKLYDRYQWVEITGLVLGSDAPLASRGVAGLSACLAQTYAEMFGASIGPQTSLLAVQFKAGLSLKLGSTRPRAAVEYY